MTAGKKMALGLCVLGISCSSLQAAPLTRSGSSGRWTTWLTNRTSDGGTFTISGPMAKNPFVSAQPVSTSTPAPAPVPVPVPASVPYAPVATGTLSLSPTYSVPAAPVASTPTPAYSASTSNSLPNWTPQISNATMSSESLAVGSSAPVIPTSAPADAFIDLGDGPYSNAKVLTTGGAQPWYNSTTAINAFGGLPSTEQRSSFDQLVLSRVEQTFQLSGMSPTFTLDPNASALHTVSVVSNTQNGSDSNAIGMTEVGGDGFGYIDKLASLKLNVDQLAWAVAHNVSHELMHAFGVGTHPDSTGEYLDSASASLAMLTDPNTTFSPTAVQLIKDTDYGLNVTGSGIGAEKLSTDPNHVSAKCGCIFCRGIYGGKTISDAQTLESPVPEPSTILVWGTSLAAAGLFVRRKRNVKSAA